MEKHGVCENEDKEPVTKEASVSQTGVQKTIGSDVLSKLAEASSAQKSEKEKKTPPG